MPEEKKKYKVNRVQNISHMCLVCGIHNDSGLKSKFYELENGDVAAVCFPQEEHQSYPGRMHGGMVSALLDETVGRAILVGKGNTWGVTVELNLQFRKPVPLDEPFWIIGRITEEKGPFFLGTGELILEDGTVAARASGRYLKVPLEKITTEWKEMDEQWFPPPEEICPDYIEIPGYQGS